MTPGDSPDLEVAPIGVTGTTGGVGRGRPFTFARDHADFLPGLAGEGGVTHGPAREVAHCDETHEEARTSRASTARRTGRSTGGSRRTPRSQPGSTSR